jgi:hypothetical protein
MSIKVYKLTSRLVSGAIYLRYENCLLTGLEFILNNPLTDDQYQWFKNNLPQYDTEIARLKAGTMEVKELKPKSIQEKIILFCQYYMHYRGVSYKAKTLEKANLKDVPVSPELLKVFFESPLSNFTLKNYIDRINITKDFAKNGQKGKRFPNVYDKDFEKTLSNSELPEYWQHLIKNGWVRVKTNSGMIWKEKTLFDN